MHYVKIIADNIKMSRPITLKQKSQKFPNSPGVYLFKIKNKPIYVGRAASLKKRIANYFQKDLDPKTSEMVSEADNVSFKKTKNLLEAVILEANLIKKHWPKYNVKEKDDRSFVYLVIPKNQEFPRPFIARGREVEKFYSSGKIFGPYQSYRLLKTALSLVRRIFPYSTCVPNSGRPCFYHQIGLCPGVCVNKISPKDYKKNINGLIDFFSGNKSGLLKNTKNLDTDKIFALKHIEDVAFLSGLENKTIGIKRIEGYDISHLGGFEAVGAMIVFSYGEPDKAGYRLFKIRGENKFDDLAMLKEILERRLKHKEWPLADVVMVDGGKNQVKVIREILKKFNLFIPIIGISKSGRHAQSSARTDKLIFGNTKISQENLFLSSKNLFQQVRNEAHRFAISFQKKRRFNLK